MDKIKVAIIDDELDFCLLLENYFVKKNYEVHVSHTLSEGLITLETFRPDIVFLDNHLPDGLGWEKAEYILAKYEHTKLNLMSAFDFCSNQVSREGSVKVWEKPISLKDLNRYLP
jgi:two-component system, OmpR family, response regulator